MKKKLIILGGGESGVGAALLASKKEYDVFAAKYVMNGELTKQGHKIEAMDKWCKAMDISVTPTIFLNGNQLPDAYLPAPYKANYFGGINFKYNF